MFFFSKNEPTLAIGGVDTEENEQCEVCPLSVSPDPPGSSPVRREESVGQGKARSARQLMREMTAETSDADPLPLRPEKGAKSMKLSLPPYP